MSSTITAFDREAEALIGLPVDELLRISIMENGAEKVENIFDKIVGVDALFKFKPSNYEMNNLDIYLTTRKVVKKVRDKGSYNIKTKAVEQIAESTIANITSDVTTPTTNTDALRKGKQVVHQDENNKSKKGNQLSATQLQNACRKGSRKGITIHDYEEGLEHVDSNGLTQVKRQKKEDDKTY